MLALFQEGEEIILGYTYLEVPSGYPSYKHLSDNRNNKKSRKPQDIKRCEEMTVVAVNERRGQRTNLWGMPNLKSRRSKRRQESTKHLFNMLSHVPQVSETKSTCAKRPQYALKRGGEKSRTKGKTESYFRGQSSLILEFLTTEVYPEK